MTDDLTPKAVHRRTMLKKRDELAFEHRVAGGAALLEFVDWRLSDTVVSLYHSIGSEIDPAPLSGSLAEQGAQLALPVLLDRQTMVFRQWDHSQGLVPVGFGTLGPDADQSEVLPDLIFAPLAAFSSTGQRIGYGKGHYDRALSKMHALGHVPALVGLAFESQECPPFPVEPHDIALDAVLTPSGLKVFDHGRDALSPFLAGPLPANQPE